VSCLQAELNFAEYSPVDYRVEVDERPSPMCKPKAQHKSYNARMNVNSFQPFARHARKVAYYSSVNAIEDVSQGQTTLVEMWMLRIRQRPGTDPVYVTRSKGNMPGTGKC
jgi:hypothetical protein